MTTNGSNPISSSSTLGVTLPSLRAWPVHSSPHDEREASKNVEELGRKVKLEVLNFGRGESETGVLRDFELEWTGGVLLDAMVRGSGSEACS